MKLYLLLFAVYVALIDAKISDYVIETWEKLADPYKNECIKLSGADVDDVDQVLRLANVPDTSAFHNFVKCVYLKLGMLSEAGEFQDWIILQGADYLNYKLLKECKNEANDEDDLALKSFKLARCIVKGLDEPRKCDCEYSHDYYVS